MDSDKGNDVHGGVANTNDNRFDCSVACGEILEPNNIKMQHDGIPPILIS